MIAMLLALCGCQATVFRALNAGTAPTQVRTHVYAPDHHLNLDVYQPAATGVHPLPVVVFFYGGSWRSGKRSDYAFVGDALAANGIVAVIADYRKYPAVQFPGFERDAAAAARWTIDHLAEWNGDRERVFIAGHSAGAQIAALLATDAQFLRAVGLRPRDFAGAIGIAGPYDFLPLTDPKLREVFGDKAQWPASQPVNFVDGDEPPFLLLQGQADRVVEPRNSDVLAKRLQAQGESVTLKRYAGIGHFRIIAAVRYTFLGSTLADTVAFVQNSQPAAKAARVEAH